MLSPADRAPSTALIDADACATDLARLAQEFAGREREMRTAVAQRLKAALIKGRAEDFLWAVRCHMHFVTGRAEERLSFDIQREIAVRLGYTAHPGMRDVERFMKHYFLVAKDVGDLTAILSAALEEREAKPMPVLDRVVARFRPRPRRVVLESDDFIADHNRINIADAA